MKHRERVERVRNFTQKNKVFVIMAVIAVIFLCSNFLFSEENGTKTEPENKNTVSEETEKTHWRFYWGDLIVLVVGGGICTVNIIKERKKAKEELQ